MKPKKTHDISEATEMLGRLMIINVSFFPLPLLPFVAKPFELGSDSDNTHCCSLFGTAPAALRTPML
jgi:hypothetical protein